MSERFTNYHDAYDYAQEQATNIGIDQGIYHQKEYGQNGFNVIMLPSPERSFGYELQAERITPNDPKVAHKRFNTSNDPKVAHERFDTEDEEFYPDQLFGNNVLRFEEVINKFCNVIESLSDNVGPSKP